MVIRFALAAILLAGALTASPSRADTDMTGVHRAALVGRLVDEVNRQRALNGVRPLAVDARLDTAAQAHSEDMAKRDYFDHKAPDGRDVGDRVRQAGYPWRIVSENISAGLSNPVSVVNFWMTSPRHRDNMLDPDVTDIGVGVAEGQNDSRNSRYSIYWTAVFAARAR